MERTSEQLEEERLMKAISRKNNPPSQPPKSTPPAQQPQKQQPPAQHHQWKYQQQKNTPHNPVLTGPVMDLSTRVNYLNSLLDQGTIDEAEYQRRAQVLQNIAKIVEAVQAGDVHLLETLLQENSGIDLNQIQEGGATIVHIAVESLVRGVGNHAVLKLLCDHGAAADPSNNGYTPLLTLCKYASRVKDLKACLEVLIKHGASVSTAVRATSANSQTRFCLDFAITGDTPLDAIEFLCQSGADPNTLTEQGPVLNYCCIQGKTAEAQILLKYNANPNSRVPGVGANCLASAINDNNVELVKHLLHFRADPKLPVITSAGTEDSITLAKVLKLSEIEQLLT